MCARGDGIRGSKDLRAEIGKFPNSTNERKQMSTKTMKQRIAVVAASALTAGFLSVSAMPAANASSTAVTITAVTGQIVAPSSSGSAGTITIAASGTVSFAVAALASTAFGLDISGGTFESVGSGGSVNASKTQYTGSAANTATVAVVAKPTAAGTNMVLTSYFGTAATAANGTLELTALAASRTAATVDRTWTVTVAPTGASGTASAGLSEIAIVNSASTSSSVTNADTPDANIIGVGGAGVVAVALDDALGVSLASTATSTATVKSGACYVGTSAAAATTPFVSLTAPDDFLYVVQSDGLTATNCSVDISANGTLMATKSFIFQGKPATVEVVSIKRGKTSANTDMGLIIVKDSAGNKIGNVTVSGAVVTPTDTTFVTAITAGSAGVTGSKSLSLGNGTVPTSSDLGSPIGYTCSSTALATPIKVTFSAVVDGGGGTIKSPVYDFYCTGDAVKYTASFDRTSYLPGDIATLTISGTDSKGFITNDKTSFASGSTGETLSMLGGQMTLASSTSTETFTNGKKEYKFTVGSTEGSFNMLVDIQKILTDSNKSLYGASVQTVAYKVAAATTAVSNADVLKSIVALIASINKQIQALQKLILARR